MFISKQSYNQSIFVDRKDAGTKLAQLLKKYAEYDPFILSLPRGGVEVGYEVAKTLKAPLDVLVVRKIGSLYNPEFAIGAIAEQDVTVLDTISLNQLGLTEDEVTQIITQESKELHRRVDLYRKGRNLPDLTDKTVIVVDDGLATGETARAALKSVKLLSPKKIVFAAPVCSKGSLQKLSQDADIIECLSTPVNLSSIGQYYYQFGQTTDKKVIELLSKIHKEKNTVH